MKKTLIIAAPIAIAALALGGCNATDEPLLDPEPQKEEQEQGQEQEPQQPESEPEAAPEEEVQPEAQAPALTDFQGLSGSDGIFSMSINEAYVDEDGTITDGMGTTERAAPGSEFVVFNVQITNESQAPAYFDWGGSYAFDTKANMYKDDYDAGWAACDSYCGEDLNPGGTAETDVVFEVPEGTELTSLELLSDPYGGGLPVTLEP